MCASPMRTPLPCGSDCGRAVAFRVTSAAGGGIAAGCEKSPEELVASGFSVFW
jgi:hypothetical protein